jgi:hypothetical protein
MQGAAKPSFMDRAKKYTAVGLEQTHAGLGHVKERLARGTQVCTHLRPPGMLWATLKLCFQRSWCRG